MKKQIAGRYFFFRFTQVTKHFNAIYWLTSLTVSIEWNLEFIQQMYTNMFKVKKKIYRLQKAIRH